MLALLPLFLPLGLFLPGFFIARWLRHTYWWASAFLISLLVLFHSIFWLELFGISIQLWTVLPIPAVVALAAAWLARRYPIAAKANPRAPWTTQDRLLLLACALVGTVLVVHSATSPLIGPDTSIRWDFLAQRLLALGHFHFYPPLTAADFRNYAFVDGIPPLVSFTDWWMYAAAGRYLPALIAISVGAQFACTLAFTYGAAAALFSRPAAALAAAILASSPIYLWAVLMGQETGMTALGMAAMIYFIVTARTPKDTPAMISAGLAATVCALSREYGCIAVVAGAIALAWRKAARREILTFAGVGMAVAAPWYIRTWILSGNPFYSLPIGGFAVNPIQEGLLRVYQQNLGPGGWTAGDWWTALLYFLGFATIPFVAGIAGGIRNFRRIGYLLAIALLMAVVWLQSVAYTSAGFGVSTRVMSPALVALSIAAAGTVEPLMRRGAWLVLAASMAWTAALGAIYPAVPSSLFTEGLAHALPHVDLPPEFQLRDPLAQVLPPGTRVLSDNCYLHAALLQRGIEVVPVWSPEVRFLFSALPEESERRLAALKIATVACYPDSLNMRYLAAASPFYAALPRRWRVLAHTGGSSGNLFLMAPNGP